MQEARPRNSGKVNSNIWRWTQRYKQRRKWTKSHIIHVLLTSFARSVRESICLLFYRIVLAPSSLCLYENLPYRPRTWLISLYYIFGKCPMKVSFINMSTSHVPNSMQIRLNKRPSSFSSVHVKFDVWNVPSVKLRHS